MKFSYKSKPRNSFTQQEYLFAFAAGIAWGLFLAIALFLVFYPGPAIAQTITATASVRFNNDNLLTTAQPAPIGGAYDFGTMQIIPLNDGKTLIIYRYILDPEYGVNIWKYTMDDAYWYVTNRGVIYGENSVGAEPSASTDLQALSIYLTL